MQGGLLSPNEFVDGLVACRPLHPAPMNARPHRFRFAARLADQPLRGAGIAELICLRALPSGQPVEGAEITVFAPRTRDGRVPRDPSLLLPEQPEFEMLRTATAEERRCFEHDGGTLRAQVHWEPGTRVYGLGEAAGPLDRRGKVVEFWNTDAWGYDDRDPALYQSHPYVLAVRPDGSALGAFADTPGRGAAQVGEDGVEFQFEGGAFDLYVIEGESPQAVQRALTALIGRPPSVPDWALGYHQCRWSYEDEVQVREVVAGFKRRGLPLDAIWFDIDYMDRHRVFTWDRSRFPDLPGLVRELQEQGVRCVAILDPGIAVAEDYDVCREGLEGEHFLLDEHGAPAVGRVWPGRCHFPDFSRPETRAWWGSRVERLLADVPFDGLWCDMNEPALFRTPGGTLPGHLRHRGAGGGTHAELHNLYGQWMVEATRAALERFRPDTAPFVLTRSSALSGGRLAATWTGDNQARWEDLRWSLSMVLNLGLSGQVFAGPDIGGFAGDPDPELFVRWFELGTYLPFFRGHSDKDSCRKEPWSFGEEVEAHVKRVLERRAALRPRLIALAEEARASGAPLCRPMFWADPADVRLHDADDQFLVGDDLLVAPILEAGVERRTVVLPPGRWTRCGAPAEAGWDASDGPIELEAPLGRPIELERVPPA